MRPVRVQLAQRPRRDMLGLDPIPGGENAPVEVAGQGVRLVRDLNQSRHVVDTLARRG